MHAAEGAFGGDADDDTYERERQSVQLDRGLAAFDDGRPVGFAASYAFEMTIPGGHVPTAGVTWVGVLPSHRRRGILREFMTRQLTDVHERGEPLAALWASESSIYGRFGYGIAAPNYGIEADRENFALRDDERSRATTRLVTKEEALPLFRDIYERARATRAGMVSRTDHWWLQHRMSDLESARRGAGIKFYAVIELDGRPEAYAMYRVAHEWDRGLSNSVLRVIEAIAATPEAYRELWRFLFSVDLVARIKYPYFDGPYFMLALKEPRRLRLSIADGLWLRLVDVDAALRARSYAGEGSVVVEVRDELCPWNEGRYRIGDGAGRTDDDAELTLDVADLASTYLGAFDFHAVAYAGRVEEHVDGALERASALVRTPLPPWCPDEF